MQEGHAMDPHNPLARFQSSLIPYENTDGASVNVNVAPYSSEPRSLEEIRQVVQMEVESRVFHMQDDISRLFRRIVDLEAQKNVTTVPQQIQDVHGEILRLASRVDQLEAQEDLATPRHQLRADAKIVRKQDDISGLAHRVDEFEVQRVVAERCQNMTQREPFSEELVALCQDNLAEDSEESLAPQSYLSYHMLMFTLRPNFRNPSFWKLILLLLLQHVIVFGFSEGTLLSMINDHLSSDRQEWLSWRTCFYDRKDLVSFLYPFNTKLFLGKPFPKCLLSVATICIIFMSSEQCGESLHTVYHNPAMSRPALWFANFVWFIQSIVIPSAFRVSTTLLVWLSKSNIDIVMIGLATQFMLDVDNVLYKYQVDKHAKLEYERLQKQHIIHGVSLRKAEASLRLLKMLTVMISVMLYCWACFGNYASLCVRLVTSETLDAEYLWNLTNASAPFILLYGIHGALLRVGGAEGDTSTRGILFKHCTDFVAFAVMGSSYYVLVVHAWLGPGYAGLSKCKVGLFDKA